MSAAPQNAPKQSPSTVPSPRVDVAERHLLGRLLILGNRGKAAADFERVEDLKFSDFYSRRHGLIFHAMKEISSRQESINITTVETELGKKLNGSTLRAIDEVTPSYLRSLLDDVCPDVGDSAKIIRKESWKRRYKSTLGDMAKLADNDNLTETQIVEKTNEQVERLTQQAIALTGNTGVSLRDSVGMVQQRVQMTVQALENDGEVLNFGIMTGLKAIDDITQGLLPGEVTVIAGSTGTGKSALGIKIAHNAMQTNHRVCFVPLEMTHLQMTQRLLAIETRISNTAIKLGRIPKEVLPRFIEACQRVQSREASQQFTYLTLDPRPNIHQLKAKLIAHINLHSPQIVIVDQASIEAMAGTAPRMDEKSILLEIMVELKAIAEKYRIHFVVIAQLNRGGAGRDGQRPVLENLASSSAVEKSAQIVILLYREHSTEQKSIEPVEVIFAKNRDGWKGTRYASFIPTLTDYVDVE